MNNQTNHPISERRERVYSFATIPTNLTKEATHLRKIYLSIRHQCQAIQFVTDFRIEDGDIYYNIIGQLSEVNERFKCVFLEQVLKDHDYIEELIA